MSVPSRFSKKNFERFEPLIAIVLQSFPKQVVFTPANYGLSMETFSCRFRDSVKAFLLYSYPATFTRAQVEETWPKCKVACALDGKTVIVGPIGGPTVMSFSTSYEKQPSKERVFQLAKQVLDGTLPTVTLEDVDDAIVADVEQQFDIGVRRDGRLITLV